MFTYSTIQSLGQVRLDEMHRQARRDALAKTARRARRAQRGQATHRTVGVRSGLTRRTHRPAPSSECL